MKVKKTEKGQAIILLTAGIITLLGFAALAIDGGRLYSERRKIQGVADTAAMTGALYLAHYDGEVGESAKNEAIQEALDRADENGYSASEVSVNIVEDSGYFVVTAEIDSDVIPVLAHLVYGGDFEVYAKSVARVEDNKVPPPFALGQAFYSINKTACRAIDMIGNNTVTINGSGLFSNSACEDDPGAINGQGSSIVVISGGVTTPGSVTIDSLGSGSSVGSINDTAEHYTLPNLTEPYCDDLDSRSLSDFDVANEPILPGVYSSGIKVNAGDTVTMDPGLYCLDEDLSVNSGALLGDGVTIFQRAGKFNITGGDNLLYAPPGEDGSQTLVDGDNNNWDGMLYFQAYGNTSQLTLTGNGSSWYQGTIFVPDGHCKIVGEGDSTGMDTQFVCDTIDVAGNADIVLSFDITNKFFPPPDTTISLVE